MAQIIKIFRESIPAMRFIGKKYDDFGHWDEWWQNGWFDRLEAAMGGTDRIRRRMRRGMSFWIIAT